MAAKTALVLIGPGNEEAEFVIPVDVLRRAGIKVTVGGLGDGPFVCRRDVAFFSDKNLEDVATELFDAVILPGGLHEHFAASQLVGEILKAHELAGRIIAAICAAPLALHAHKIGFGKSLTHWPGMKEGLLADYKYVDDQLVVRDGQLITSRGPGTAFLFSLEIVKALMGEEKSKQIADALLL